MDKLYIQTMECHKQTPKHSIGFHFYKTQQVRSRNEDNEEEGVGSVGYVSWW